MGNGQRQGWLKRAAGAFGRDRRGNVAMMWGLMAAVLVGMIGLSVDFARAQTMRARLQNAADGAALVAERASALSMTDRTAAARAFFDAEMGDFADDATFAVTQVETGGHRVDASMPMPVTLARIIKNEDWEIGVTAEAQAQASPPIEVVLALDNTGSMASDMDTLRDGAETLAEFLLGLDGDSVKVGLVPFVAQVNIGTGATQMAWMDTAGTNPHHGEFFEDRYMGYRNQSGGCTNAALFPPTYGGMAVTWVRGAAANPAPYTNTGRCYAFSSTSVNIFSLYNNLPATAAWRGCVEARPAPYDIDDTAPNAGTPATMFVPYFSPDEGGDDVDANNWVTSGTYDRTDVFGMGAGTFTPNTTLSSSVRTTAPYKYRAGVTVSINDVAGTTNARGPNRGCPTPIVPLTSNDNTVITAIQGMQHWYGGGTNQIEGLSWAWRVISPTAPYTQGRPYNDPQDPVRKVIVLFTDGDNTSLDSGNAALESEYAALSVRAVWRTLQTVAFPAGSPGIPAAWRRNGISNSGNMVTYMNAREALLCEAIKDAGIEIYAIGFRITAGGTADQLLANCATQDGSHYYHADNQAELLEAFSAIGTGIGQLRLTH